MADLWRPGALSEALAKTGVRGRLATARSIDEAAVKLERDAKVSVGRFHPYGTKTPAKKNGPPASITGTLRRSIVTGPPEPFGGEYSRRVGMAAGVYPPKVTPTVRKDGVRSHKAAGGHGKTPSSRYAFFLETRVGYPFLHPAYDRILPKIPEIFRRNFNQVMELP